MSNIIGYVVLANRYKVSPLHYVGHYTKDGGDKALFNGIDHATIFRTRREANAAIRASKKYWNGGSKFYSGKKYNIDTWNVIALTGMV